MRLANSFYVAISLILFKLWTVARRRAEEFIFNYACLRKTNVGEEKTGQ